MLVAGAYKGYEAKKLKEQEAKGLREAAGRRMAATSREMSEEIRRKEYMHSRALSVAAASGAGTEGGVVKLLADLNAEGEYRVLSVLWAGKNEAAGLMFAAESAEKAGDAAQTAGIIDGITSAVSAYVGMGGAFGGGGAPSATAGGAAGSGALRPSAATVFGGGISSYDPFAGMFPTPGGP